MWINTYILIPFLGEWTSIYQLFWCSPGVQGFDTLPCVNTANISHCPSGSAKSKNCPSSPVLNQSLSDKSKNWCFPKMTSFFVIFGKYYEVQDGEFFVKSMCLSWVVHIPNLQYWKVYPLRINHYFFQSQNYLFWKSRVSIFSTVGKSKHGWGF